MDGHKKLQGEKTMITQTEIVNRDDKRDEQARIKRGITLQQQAEEKAEELNYSFAWSRWVMNTDSKFVTKLHLATATHILNCC